MAQPKPTYTTGQLAQLLAAELVGPADLELTSIGALEDARPGALSFIRSADFARLWGASQASAALVTKGVQIPDHDPERRAILYVDDADAALVRVLNTVAPEPDLPAPGVDPTAAVDPSASVDPTARVGPLCRVGANTIIGPGAALVSSVVIGRNASIGADTVLHAGVVVQHDCVVGDRCLFHPGVVVGADGFGFITSHDDTPHVKIPHLGNVVIGNDVELGANSCVDRAKLGSTTLADGCKTDNLVHVGHNCHVGRNVIICGGTVVGGSVKIGDRTLIGGKVAIADGTIVGEDVRIGGAAAVVQCEIPAGETWWGTPAGPAREAMANLAALRKLAKTLKELRRDIDALKADAARTPS
ncbi:MAG: UDP-3-O-(3-hydroxymyristoyl)glucosamine N-acyltransferase [Phycisphaerales bacterium]